LTSSSPADVPEKFSLSNQHLSNDEHWTLLEPKEDALTKDFVNPFENEDEIFKNLQPLHNGLARVNSKHGSSNSRSVDMHTMKIHCTDCGSLTGGGVSCSCEHHAADTASIPAEDWMALGFNFNDSTPE
jgi:hypothetical protein